MGIDKIIDSHRRGAEQEAGSQDHGRKSKIVKISRHASEQIMTHDTGKEDRLISEIALPYGLDLPKDRGERIKILSKVVNRAMGLTLSEEDCPDQVGFNLTHKEERQVLIGVLSLLTDTQYRGTEYAPVSGATRDNDTLISRPESKKISKGGSYENIQRVPILRVSPTDLMIASGLDPKDRSDKVRAKEALGKLATKRGFCIWLRYKRDDRGKIVTDRNGKRVYEIVSETNPALFLRTICKPKTGEIEYYEIQPHPIFLDQVTQDYGGGTYGYFMPLENDWEKEIESVLPKGKKISQSIPIFLYWLRLRYHDLYLQNKNPLRKNPLRYEIEISFEDLCKSINLRENAYKKNPHRAEGFIDQAVDVARSIGYLTESSRTLTGGYHFVLNPDKYPTSRKISEAESDDQETGFQDPDENSI